MTRTRERQRRTATCGAALLALGLVPVAAFAQDLAEAAGADTPVELVEPLAPTSVDDDRVWEDVSYGTGEADFTAIAIDPENPRRLYAGANGAVYVSDDGGVTWLRVLRVRGAADREMALAKRGAQTELENEVDDRVNDLREELVEEIKREITDELVAELGDFGEQLADELAEELAQQQVDEEQDRLVDEARDELARRGRAPAEAEDEEPSPAAVEPRRIHRIVALAKGRVLVASGSGLFESKDYGQTFEEVASFGAVPEERDIRAVAVHPLQPAMLIVATSAGVYFTGDGGETWTESSGFSGKLVAFDVAIDPAQPQRIVAATEQGIFRSVDGGVSFVAVHQPSSPPARLTRTLAFDPLDPRIVFAGTQEGLFRSLDAGGEWERVEAPGLVARDLQDFGSAEWGLVVATSNGVFLSADSGASFRELYAGLDSPDVRRVATGATPLETYAASGRGLFSYRAPEARARKLRALSEVQALVRGEPTVAEVAREAVARAYADVPMESWRTRAALAPYVPKVVVNLGWVNPFGDIYEERSVFAQPPSFYNFYDRTDAWLVTAQWDATRFIYNEGLIATSSTFRRIEKVRARVLRRVVNTYNARRRLQVSLIQNPPGDLRSLAQKQLQVDELTAVLDALTDGTFSARLATNSPAPAPASSSRTR